MAGRAPVRWRCSQQEKGRFVAQTLMPKVSVSLVAP